MTQFATSIIGIKEDLAAGKYTSVDLVEDFYQRIDRLDQEIHGYITLNKEEAIKAAQAADQAGYGPDSPKLNGVPLAIKDNILTEDLKTTCLLYTSPRPRD